MPKSPVFLALALLLYLAACTQQSPAPSSAPASSPAPSTSATAPAPTPASTPSTDPLAAAAFQVVDALMKKQGAALIPRFDATMKGAMTPAQLDGLWDGLAAQCGRFKSLGGVRSLKIQQYDCRFVRCEFEKAAMEVKVVFDPAGKVAGLFFVPAPPAAPDAPAAVPAGLVEKEVTVGSGEWALPGTLTLPQGAGPFPAVVLVHGSGPADRDETVGALKPFRDLAQGLVVKGVAVLRYEKRTLQHRVAMARGVSSITVKEETIDDALAAVVLLRARPEIDPQRVFLAGHSLGGMLIPRLAQGAPEAAGFIILAGTTRPLEDVMLEQLEYLASLEPSPSKAMQDKLAEVRQEIKS